MKTKKKQKKKKKKKQKKKKKKRKQMHKQGKSATEEPALERSVGKLLGV